MGALRCQGERHSEGFLFCAVACLSESAWKYALGMTAGCTHNVAACSMPLLFQFR